MQFQFLLTLGNRELDVLEIVKWQLFEHMASKMLSKQLKQVPQPSG